MIGCSEVITYYIFIIALIIAVVKLLAFHWQHINFFAESINNNTSRYMSVFRLCPRIPGAIMRYRVYPLTHMH